MAYRPPEFYFRNAVRDAVEELGAAALNATAGSPDPEGLLADDRLDDLYRAHTSPQTVLTIDLDRGAGVLEEIDTLIVARGNHWDTSPVTRINRLEEDDNAGMTSPNNLIPTTAAAPADDPIWKVTFTGTALPERYVRLEFDLASGTKIFQLGDYWLTERRVLTRGPEPAWRQDFISNVAVSETDAGVEYTRTRGAARKRFRMTWRKLSGLDLTTLKVSLLAEAAHTAHPFFFLPPDDAYGLGFYRLARDVQVRMDSPVPSALETFRVDLDLIEVLG